MIKGSLDGYDFLIDRHFEVTCKSFYLRQKIESGIRVWLLDSSLSFEQETLKVVQRLKDAGAKIEVYQVSDEEDEEFD